TNVLERVTGPMQFRFIVQPSVAIVLALHAGLKDAAANRPPYFWTILTDAAQRRMLLRSGWKDIGRLCVMAFAIDTIYQLIEFDRLYPVESLIITGLLAVVPYLLVRGPTTRVASRLVRVRSIVVAACLLGVASAASADMPKYRVKVTADKHTDFAKI